MGTEAAGHLLTLLLVLEGIAVGCQTRGESFRANQFPGAELPPKPFAAKSALASCDFDDAGSPFCDWTQPKDDSGDWIRGEGKKPGESPGPPGGVPERRGHYVYPEEGASVLLQSPDLDPAAPETCVEFLYYLYSLDSKGQLAVKVQYPSGNSSTLWTRRGMESSSWLLGAVTVQNPSQRPFKVVFAATQVKTEEITIALDSISVRIGPCASCVTGCDFDNDGDLCQWENPADGDVQWEQWVGAGDLPGVGPEDDFSKPGFGFYMLLNSLGGSGTALLKSPLYQSLGSCLSLSFYYTLHGVSNNTGLRVYAAQPGGELGPALLSLAGEHGPDWKPGRAVYSGTSENIQFIIEGTYAGKPGVAVDSVRISPCEETFAECNFNDAADPFCGWLQPSDNKANWTWTKGYTPTEETGPPGDYPDGKGHYIYVEAGCTKPGQATRLSSRGFCTDTDACVEFYYYMHGIVEVDTQLRVLAHGPWGPSTLLWSRTGIQSPAWLLGSVTVPYGGPQPSKVVFEVVRGSNPYMDVALDNISIRKGACAESGTTIPPPTSTAATSTTTVRPGPITTTGARPTTTTSGPSPITTTGTGPTTTTGATTTTGTSPITTTEPSPITTTSGPSSTTTTGASPTTTIGTGPTTTTGATTTTGTSPITTSGPSPTTTTGASPITTTSGPSPTTVTNPTTTNGTSPTTTSGPSPTTTTVTNPTTTNGTSPTTTSGPSPTTTTGASPITTTSGPSPTTTNGTRPITTTSGPSPTTTSGPSPTTTTVTNPTTTNGTSPTTTSGPSPTTTNGTSPTTTSGPSPTTTTGASPITTTSGPSPTTTNGTSPITTSGPSPTTTTGASPITTTSGPSPTTTTVTNPTTTNGTSPTTTSGPSPTTTTGASPITTTSGPSPTTTNGTSPITTTSGPSPTTTTGTNPTTTNGTSPTTTTVTNPTTTNGTSPTTTSGPSPTTTNGTSPITTTSGPSPTTTTVTNPTTTNGTSPTTTSGPSPTTTSGPSPITTTSGPSPTTTNGTSPITTTSGPSPTTTTGTSPTTTNGTSPTTTSGPSPTTTTGASPITTTSGPSPTTTTGTSPTTTSGPSPTTTNGTSPTTTTRASPITTTSGPSPTTTTVTNPTTTNGTSPTTTSGPSPTTTTGASPITTTSGPSPITTTSGPSPTTTNGTSPTTTSGPSPTTTTSGPSPITTTSGPSPTTTNGTSPTTTSGPSPTTTTSGPSPITTTSGPSPTTTNGTSPTTTSGPSPTTTTSGPSPITTTSGPSPTTTTGPSPTTTPELCTSTPSVSTTTTTTAKPPVPPADQETCTISGDPHYATYDGRRFDFMGTCTYLLSAPCNATSGLPDFRVEATNEHRGNNKQVSYVKSVSVEVYGTRIGLLKGRRVTVDSQRVALPVSLADGRVSVRLSGTFVLVQTDFGLWVRFDGNHHAEVSVPEAYFGKLCGLCGNYNGQPSDDNLMPDGTSAGSDVNKLGESWQVPGATDPGCTNSGDPGECDKDIEDDAKKPTSCGILTDPQGPFAPCHNKVPPEGAFQNCVYDLCGTDGDTGSLCFALQSYADRCAQAGIPIAWRNSSFCPLNCPPGSNYTSCGPACPATCTEPPSRNSCNLPCVEGCICNKGFVLSGDQCVPLGQCGCTDPGGQYHPVGESWMGNSNCTQRCTCAPLNNITCEEWSCSPVQECQPVEGLLGCQDTGVAACHVAGDPHYYTFDGTMVSFMGTCTYTLVTLCHADPRLPAFNITAKNEERGQPEASYLRLVTVEVAGATVTLQKSRRVLIDGQRVRTPVEGRIPGVSITTSGIYVVLETDFGLVVKFDGNHHLEIQLPGTYFDKVCGMCGSFNNQSGDDLLMPNGHLATNASQFGNSWKAPGDADPGCQPDDREDLEPPCSAQEMERLRGQCRDILGPKYQPCHATIDPQPFFQNCLYDMCEYQGMASVLCDNIQSYVEACKSQGVDNISWRNSTFCPLPCPAHSHYTECSSPCPATCSNLYAPASCQRPTTCVEGCACDRGYVLSDDSCVLMRDCGCLSTQNEYYNPGETWVTANCLERCTCVGNGKITCQSFRCLDGSVCALSTAGLHYCRPTRFHQCVISGDPHYNTFDNFVHHFQGRSTYTLTRTLADLPESLEPLSVAGRNRRRFPFQSFSFLREVYVEVYGYSIQLLQGRKMAVNGVMVTTPYSPRDGLQITQRGRTICVETDFGLSVYFDGQDFGEIVLPSTYRTYVGGLCGNYDGQRNNEYMKPDRTWTRSLNTFGNSWEVMVPSREREAGSHPRIRREEPSDEVESGFDIACSPEQLISVNGTGVCGALSDPQGPFSACHAVLSPSPFQENCVYDLCALMGDTELLCQDYDAYAKLCQEEGVTLGAWRQKTGCEISCPPHTTYKSCMTACPNSCANMAAQSECDAPCVEGCASDPGYVLSGLDSVPYNQCGCTDNNQYYQINDTFLTEDCSKRCTCRNTGTLECEPVACAKGDVCGVVNFTRGCYRESACLRNNCQNEGVCQDTLDGTLGYVCVCTEGYNGTYCETAYDVQPPSPSTDDNNLTVILIGVLVPLALILMVVTGVCIYRQRRSRREHSMLALSDPGQGTPLPYTTADKTTHF
ncbi:zonadhesin [Podarcis muralis]